MMRLIRKVSRLAVLADFARVLMIGVLATVATGAGIVQADNLAATVTGLQELGTGVDGVHGWLFTPTADITVTQLGVLDYNYDNGAGKGLLDSHPIGIWSPANTSTPIVSVTVPSGISASITNYVRYVPVSPTLLKAGAEYVIAAYYPYHSDQHAADCMMHGYNPNGSSNLQIDSRITVINYVWEQTSGLSFPYENGLAKWGAEVGPDFQFTTVPEPSTIALLLIAILGGLLVWRRRS